MESFSSCKVFSSLTILTRLYQSLCRPTMIGGKRLVPVVLGIEMLGFFLLSHDWVFSATSTSILVVRDGDIVGGKLRIQ